MKKIAAALDSHDAAALKAMFSKRAVEKATDLDARLESLLSTFPNGGVTWKEDGYSSEGTSHGDKRTQLLGAFYKLSADGKDYSLFFADFTVNEVTDPDNVGIYALGIVPWSDNIYVGAIDSFGYWTSKIKYDESDAEGYPGVYVGYDNSQLSLHKMADIVQKVSIQDDVGLRQKFTEYAQAAYAANIDAGIDKLYALFPKGQIVWQKKGQQPAPVVREEGDKGSETTLLLSTYRVSSGASDYLLAFAYFPQNASNPQNEGIYAIGVAPRTASGDSAAEKALSSWLDTFDVDASTPPGVFIPES
jgi:hypothetical protein